MNTLIDPFGRKVDYLRLSVTDRCNLRCVYCLPASGYAFVPSPDLLTDDETVRAARVAVQVGMNKVRITGGEPLTRPGIVGLVARLSALPGLQDLSMSTNGVFLAGLAKDLRCAGLKRINISLDTLQAKRFTHLTHLGKIVKVLDGLEAALMAGFSPVKINMVVMRGINDDEIPDFIALSREKPLHVRFIELMPIGETGFFSADRWVSLAEIRSRCGTLEPVALDAAPRGYGPALYHRSPSAKGTVGFISALSCNFCQRCNRLRLTSRGRLAPCLVSDAGVDLRALLRSGANDALIEEAFGEAVSMKPEKHRMGLDETAVRESFMCGLGG